MKCPNIIKRTDLSGNSVTLRDWLAQLGKWTRLANRMGPLANAAVWQKPVTACVAWEFTWFDCVSLMVREIESQELVFGIWDGVPKDLVQQVSSGGLVQAVLFPAHRNCRLGHWKQLINEAIVRYDPIAAFREGRFLRTKPRKFRDQEAIIALLTHAARTEVVDSIIDYQPNDIFWHAPQWGWSFGIYGAWRNPTTCALRYNHCAHRS